MKKISGQLWRRQAVCAVETPDAPEVWTPHRKPRLAALVALEQMCGRCPVQRDCALHALSSQAEGGMYAGVWVPGSQDPKWWSRARKELCKVAGVDPETLGFDVTVGVSA